MNDNPFDQFDLDPLATPDEITERLRERIEDASPTERDAMRRVWEHLTLHPKHRLELALGTFVDREPEVVSRPPPTPPVSRTGPLANAAASALLSIPMTDLHATLVREGLAGHEPSGYVPIDSDPLLKDPER